MFQEGAGKTCPWHKQRLQQKGNLEGRHKVHKSREAAAASIQSTRENGQEGMNSRQKPGRIV
jgi:hypothetical protein